MSESEHALSISERITEGIGIKTVFTIHAFGYSVPISDTVVATWIVMAILIVASLILTRRFREIPKKPQLLLEAFIGFIQDFIVEKAGHHGKDFVAFLGTLFIFLIAANLAPMITPIGGFGFEPLFEIKPLTRDINVTAALAIIVIVTVFLSSFRYKGVGGWLKSLVSPSPVMLPFKLMEYAIKPLSLCLRLFGNILGAFIIMRLIEIVMPVAAPPLAGLYFDLFDGLIQAVVFAFLSTVYIAEAIE
jgi:F-type H+-transporting ATPase subunit a